MSDPERYRFLESGRYKDKQERWEEYHREWYKNDDFLKSGRRFWFWRRQIDKRRCNIEQIETLGLAAFKGPEGEELKRHFTNPDQYRTVKKAIRYQEIWMEDFQRAMTGESWVTIKPDTDRKWQELDDVDHMTVQIKKSVDGCTVYCSLTSRSKNGPSLMTKGLKRSYMTRSRSTHRKK